MRWQNKARSLVYLVQCQVYSIFNTKTYIQTYVYHLLNLIGDPKRAADRANRFFVSIGSNLTSVIPTIPKVTRDYRTVSQCNSLGILPVTVEQINSIVA